MIKDTQRVRATLRRNGFAIQGESLLLPDAGANLRFTSKHRVLYQVVGETENSL